MIPAFRRYKFQISTHSHDRTRKWKPADFEVPLVGVREIEVPTSQLPGVRVYLLLARFRTLTKAQRGAGSS